jgi:hypothetical protein
VKPKRTVFASPLGERQPLLLLGKAENASDKWQPGRSWWELTPLLPFLYVSRERPDCTHGEGGGQDGQVAEHGVLGAVHVTLSFSTHTYSFYILKATPQDRSSFPD